MRRAENDFKPDESSRLSGIIGSIEQSKTINTFVEQNNFDRNFSHIENKSYKLETHSELAMQEVYRGASSVPQKDVDNLISEMISQVNLDNMSSLNDAPRVPSSPLLEKKERTRKKKLWGPQGSDIIILSRKINSCE